jgi:L-fuconolactonase
MHRTPRQLEQWLALREPEAPLDASMPIVDPHMHFFHRGEHRYFVEEFALDVASSGHNVQATVAIECQAFWRASGAEALRCVGETEFFVGMAATCESGKYTPARGAAGIVPYADFTLGERVRPVLEAHIEAGNGRVKGIRQPSKWDADPVVRGTYGPQRPGLYLDPSFRKGLAVATSLGLSLDASVYHAQLPDLIDLARAHPDANIVLIHCGSPTGRGSYAGKEQEVYANWRRDMRTLATCPNVTVKLGGILHCLHAFDFENAPHPPGSAELAELWRPWLEGCIELFGPGRCMASSNFPVEKSGMRYGTLWNMYQRLTAAYSPEEKAAMFSGNAKRIYRLA